MSQNLFFSMFSQGVWSCHFLDLNSKYVHPVSSEGPLWLCLVRTNLAGTGGGQCIRTFNHLFLSNLFRRVHTLSLIAPLSPRFFFSIQGNVQKYLTSEVFYYFTMPRLILNNSIKVWHFI